MLWKLCTGLKIRSYVFEVSRIGNSLAEIYVRRDHYADVLECCEEAGVKVIERLNLMEVPEHGSGREVIPFLLKRLTWLYRSARLVRLRDCILEGIPQEYQDAIREIGDDSRKGRGDRHDANRLINSFFEDFFKSTKTAAAAETVVPGAAEVQDEEMEDVGGNRDAIHA